MLVDGILEGCISTSKRQPCCCCFWKCSSGGSFDNVSPLGRCMADEGREK